MIQTLKRRDINFLNHYFKNSKDKKDFKKDENSTKFHII